MEVATRQMPRTQERALIALEKGERVYDGRSEKTIGTLIDLEFVKVVATDKKNARKRTIKITERGTYALERVRRGVDPYLRMTT